MEIIIGLITILGFVIAIFVLVFTEQGHEIYYNVRCILKGLFRKKRTYSNTNKDATDKSKFISDITIPDGSKIKVGQKFRKIWEIKNVGSCTWRERYLKRQGPIEGPGRIKSSLRKKIPYTLPGESCKITIHLTAPDLPGSCYAEWKMVDKDDNILLANQKAIYVAIDIIE